MWVREKEESQGFNFGSWPSGSLSETGATWGLGGVALCLSCMC